MLETAALQQTTSQAISIFSCRPAEAVCV